MPTSGATINVLHGGKGAPLLLIHGHPETHVTWHKVTAELAKDYTVVIPDLRGYGDSSKPEGGENNANYSFRAMALDQVEVMRHLGFEQFFVAGHDRGGRVVHRLCLDHPNSVRKATVMDVAPTLTMYRDTTKVPLQALWGAKGVVGKLWDVLATWRPKVAGTLTGQALDCGHLLPEEQPAAVIEALRSFCT